jgi:hypothetical protein
VFFDFSKPSVTRRRAAGFARTIETNARAVAVYGNKRAPLELGLRVREALIKPIIWTSLSLSDTVVRPSTHQCHEDCSHVAPRSPVRIDAVFNVLVGAALLLGTQVSPLLIGSALIVIVMESK